MWSWKEGVSGTRPEASVPRRWWSGWREWSWEPTARWGAAATEREAKCLHITHYAKSQNNNFSFKSHCSCGKISRYAAARWSFLYVDVFSFILKVHQVKWIGIACKRLAQVFFKNPFKFGSQSSSCMAKPFLSCHIKYCWQIFFFFAQPQRLMAVKGKTKWKKKALLPVTLGSTRVLCLLVN